MIHSNILLVILVSSVCHIQGQSQCMTPTSRKGTCIPIKNCPQLLALVTNPKRTSEQLQLLKDSQCGIDSSSPMVCCATEDAVDGRCITPEGIEGSCIDIKLCPILKKLLNPPASKRNVNYVKNHRCDESDENRVCCINCQKILGPPHKNTGCCGIDKFGTKPDPDTVVTSIYQYPWMVLIEYEKPHNKTESECGGVLISSKYVLSAAHCFNARPNRLTPKSVLRLGEYDTTRDGPDCVDVGDNQECTDGAISIPIESIHLHHRYDVRLIRHDIALLRLKHDVDYTDFIRPICLPSTDVEENEPHTLYVVGFGKVNESNISNKKLHVDLPFVPSEECYKLYKAFSRIIWEGHICAGGVLGRSTCSGDSGGPLMSYNEHYELTGLVSFSEGCGIQNVPNVFTRVYHYLPWIRSKIKP